MTMVQFGTTFDVTAYNHLLSVEDADKTVRIGAGDSLRDRFLAAAAKLVCSYDLQSRFGVSLLHQHFPCESGERLVEATERVDGREALVTRPSLNTAPEEDCPIVWHVGDASLDPVAFSRDVRVRALQSAVQPPAAFLSDFAELTRRFGVQHLFGLAVAERDLYQRAGDGQKPVEFSDMVRRSSTVILLDADEIRNNTIETLWTFKRAVDSMTDCVSTCQQQCWNMSDGRHHSEHVGHHIGRPD